MLISHCGSFRSNMRFPIKTLKLRSSLYRHGNFVTQPFHNSFKVTKQEETQEKYLCSNFSAGRSRDMEVTKLAMRSTSQSLLPAPLQLIIDKGLMAMAVAT